MPSLPIAKTFESQHAETIEERFRRLEAQWMKETGHLSSTSKIIGDPNFQEIIALGLPVVSLMLRVLEEKPRLWVWALPAITGTDPVLASDRGNITKMSEAWLHWGKANGYQW